MTLPKVLTANRLLSGDVVFFASDLGWVESLSQATVATATDEITVLEQLADGAESQGEVIGAYLIDLDEDPLTPRRNRERIRATGPTVRPDLARLPAQTVQEPTHVSV